MRARFFVAVFLASAQVAGAFDSTGGSKTKDIVGRIKFIDLSGEYDPRLFEWTQENKEKTKRAFSEALMKMPLDVAELPMIEFQVSNSRCSIPVHMGGSDVPGNTPEEKSTTYYRWCEGDSADYSPGGSTDGSYGSGVMSGSYFLLSQDSSLQKKRGFAAVVLHEAVHAWEIGSDGETKKPTRRTREFYLLGYDTRAEAWKKILAKNPGADRQEEGKLYAAQGLPARYGGEAGPSTYLIYRKKDVDHENAVDRHAMDEFREYLAVLAEMLWSTPDLARRYYSAKEIAWVEKYVFGSRAVIPFDPDSAQGEKLLKETKAAQAASSRVENAIDNLMRSTRDPRGW